MLLGGSRPRLVEVNAATRSSSFAFVNILDGAALALRRLPLVAVHALQLRALTTFRSKVSWQCLFLQSRRSRDWPVFSWQIPKFPKGITVFIKRSKNTFGAVETYQHSFTGSTRSMLEPTALQMYVERPEAPEAPPAFPSLADAP